MKMLLAAGLVLVGLGATATPSSAMTGAPLSATDNSLVQTIAGGCGRGYHPNRNGHCVSNGYGYGYQPGYAQPRYYNPPVRRAYCPPGRHPGNSGKCVPNY